MLKKYLSVSLLASVAFISSFCTNNIRMQPPRDAGKLMNESSGFAVIELFTSEGCSSCPSADRAVEELARRYPEKLFILAFHVDYWNRLGWTDSFSKAAFTQRQGDYATQFALTSIYTPQVVVNGNEEFVGSNKSRLEQATERELQKPGSTALNITAESLDSKTITVHYSAGITGKQKLNLALVQNEATTNVKRGENGGRTLHHINIVRDYKTVSAKEGRIEFQLPSGLRPGNVMIVAYQQEPSGTITAVTKANVREM